MAKIEVLIFAAEEPVNIKELSNTLEVSKREIEDALEILIDEYNQDKHGFYLKKYNDGYLFVSKSEYSSIIKDMHNKKVYSLSSAALETLAIIAYKQPVTRAEIEEIRGVKAEKTLLTLNKYELIQELGRKETIGNPIVYGTTDKFLRYFDLHDLSDLPEVELEEQVEKEIEEQIIHEVNEE